MRAFLAAFCLLLTVTSIGGTIPVVQVRQEFTELHSAESLNCTFPWSTALEWEGDEPRVGAQQQDFGFQIDGIDHEQGVARIIGNAGADHLVVVKGEHRLSFIERTPSGNLNLTTVYAWRTPRGFKAVHSRHTGAGGPTASQNYGFCEIWE